MLEPLERSCLKLFLKKVVEMVELSEAKRGQRVEVRVLGRSFSPSEKGGSGYVRFAVKLPEGEKAFTLYVEREGRRVSLSLGARRNIPLSRAKLLLEQPEFDQLLDKEKKRLVAEIQALVYSLLELEKSPARAVFRARCGDYSLVLYEDRTLAAFGKGWREKVPLEDERQVLELRAKLLARLKGDGVADAEEQVERAFKALAEWASAHPVLEVGNVRVKPLAKEYAVRRMWLESGRLHYRVWVYGEVTVGDAALEGAVPILFISDGKRVEWASEEGEYIVLPPTLAAGAALRVEEMQELLAEIKRVNEGKEEPPAWSEVLEDIVQLSRKAVGVPEFARWHFAYYIMHTYFFELFERTFYLAPIGPSGSGKGAAGEFIAALTFSARTASPSIASVARLSNAIAPVWIIDETRLDDEEWRLFLNMGTQRGLMMLRCNRENPDETQPINPYAPKVLLVQPDRWSQVAHDVQNRTVKIEMLKEKDRFAREIPREEAWPVKKKLILLALYRWREYLEAFEKVDEVVSRHFAGHARDVWAHLLALALLCGPEHAREVAEKAVEEYARKEDIDPKIAELVQACLAATALFAASSEGGENGLRETEALEGVLVEKAKRDGGREEWVLRATPKALAKALGYEDREAEGAARTFGRLLKRGRLPFVLDFTRVGRKRERYYMISLPLLADYAKRYEIELPEEVDAELLKAKYGIEVDAGGGFRGLVEAIARLAGGGGELQCYGRPGEKTSETSATPAPQTEPLASQAEPPYEEARTEASKVILSRQKINGEVEEGKGKVPADVSDAADVGTPATPQEPEDEAAAKALELFRSGVQDVREAVKMVLPGAEPAVRFRVARKVLQLLEAEGVLK